jgi:hypothetical protein
VVVAGGVSGIGAYAILEGIVDEREESQLAATPSGRFGDGGEESPTCVPTLPSG